MNEQQLPPLPKPAIANGPGSMFRFNYYNAEQMQAYARAALAANLPADLTKMRNALLAIRTSIKFKTLTDEQRTLIDAALAAPAPEADPCIYPACQTNGCREACESPAQAQQSETLPVAALQAIAALERIDHATEGDRLAAANGLRAALKATPAQAQQSLTHELQQQCSDWGVYWRASDAHGVDLSMEQAEELLRRALGVEVAIAKAKPEAQQPEYRLLGKGDVLQDGDECLLDGCKSWAPITPIFRGHPHMPGFHVPHRRQIAQASGIGASGEAQS